MPKAHNSSSSSYTWSRKSVYTVHIINKSLKNRCFEEGRRILSDAFHMLLFKNQEITSKLKLFLHSVML